MTGSRMAECYDVASNVVKTYKIHKVLEVTNKPFTAISYYFDRATEVHLVSKYSQSQTDIFILSHTDISSVSIYLP